MNEIVKYNNFMNQLSFKGFTPIDMNVLMALCNRMRDKDIERMEFTFEELRELTGYKQTSKEQFIKDIKRMNDKLQRVNCSFETEEEYMSFVLFPTYRIIKAKETLVVALNQDFKFILNSLANNFTRFDLQDFVRIESVYAKNLYRLLKQYRSTGFFKITNIEEFRKIMDCPIKYANKHFIDKIIKPSVEILKDFFIDLKYEPLYAKKRGKPLDGFEFTFQKEQFNKSSQPQDEQIEGQMDIQDFPTYLPSQSKKSKNKFNDYPQRKYTDKALTELEQALLNR